MREIITADKDRTSDYFSDIKKNDEKKINKVKSLWNDNNGNELNTEIDRVAELVREARKILNEYAKDFEDIFEHYSQIGRFIEQEIEKKSEAELDELPIDIILIVARKYIDENKDKIEKDLEEIPEDLQEDIRLFLSSFDYTPFYDKKVTAELEKATAILGEKMYLSRSKVAKGLDNISKDTKEYGGSKFVVSGKKEKKIETDAKIQSSDTALGIEYQMCIDAIGSICQSNINVDETPIFRVVASVDQLARELYGLKPRARVSDSFHDTTKKLINYLSTEARGEINYTVEIEKHGKKSISGGKLKGFLVAADEITVNSGGKEVDGYVFYRLPITYQYSHETKQMTDFERKIFITDGRNTTFEYAKIKWYILHSIEETKGGMSQKKLYKTMFEKLEIKNPSKQNIKTYRKNVVEYLTHLKKQKYIKDFVETTSGRTYDGFKIFL